MLGISKRPLFNLISIGKNGSSLTGLLCFIVLLNDQPLIECIISDGNVINSVGMLECEYQRRIPGYFRNET